MNQHPHFIIIGAMKCATTTLHKQLVAQPGIFMSEPKEPNFFSDDEQYAKGIDWYQGLFADAKSSDLCGEASTHYTKLPTYPHTVERLYQYCPNAKLIYMMRHPIDRLVSHYIHEWTQKVIHTDINTAIDQHPELIAYSQYAMQLKPFIDTFGTNNILPIFFERFCLYPQEELARACQFIGYKSQPTWVEEFDQHSSTERLRKSIWRDFLVDAPILSTIRKNLIPQSFRDWVKSFWQMKEKPQINAQQQANLEKIFNEDLSILGSWLNIKLSCNTFKSEVKSNLSNFQ